MSEEDKPSKQDSIKILNLARDGDLTQLKVLKKFIPQTFDQFGATPTHYAARGGQLVILRWLRAEFGEQCFGVNARGGASPAHDAAALGHLPSLEFILNQVDSALLEIQDETGASPLHLATRFDHLQVVQWLVEVKGCEVLSRSKRGITPVHIAAGRGAKTCLRWFIRVREGAANSRTENGATPVYYAAQEGRLDCLKLIVLEGQGNPRQRAYDGMTPLHAAAQNGHLHCVIWLVTHGGVSVMERDKEGATPGHYAAARGHVNVLRWLLQNGAVAVKDELGGTPLHDAAEHGQIGTVRVLMEAGADLMARDVDGQTAEQVAERAGHLICVECIRAVMRQRSLPLSRRFSQPMERNKQHRFSMSSARSAGKDFYKSISRRKKQTPNTVSSPNLASLMAKEGVENGVELVAELKSSKSAPSSGRSPRMGRRATFLKSSPSDGNMTDEKQWLLKGGPEGDQMPLPVPRNLPIHSKTAFSQIAPPFPSPDPLVVERKGAHFNIPATPPTGFKSQQNILNDSIPSVDRYGESIPDWRRLIIARKATKQLQDSSSSYSQIDTRLRSKSLSEQSVRSSLVDTQNVQIMPKWKRELLQKRGLKLEKITEPSL